MAISLFAANEGYLDDVEAEKIVAFEAGLHGSFRDNHADLMQKINESGDLNDEITEGLKKAVEEFKQNGAY